MLFPPVMALGACMAAPARVPALPASQQAPVASLDASDAPSASASESASVVASASAPASPQPPFNVLLLTIDSLRADMPWAGYSREIAPRLTEFARTATLYREAYSISSFTSKSVGGLLGGRFPSELKRTSSFFTRYLPENRMFAEDLHDQGIFTLGGHAHAFFGKGQSGFEQGFDDWRLVPGITFDYNKDPYITSQKLTPMAIEMLSQERITKGDRFFAWFHYMDPHDVYQHHPEAPRFDGARGRPRDLYDEEVFYTDLWIGKLLDWVDQQPWAKRTVVIVTADHGEAFGEHQLWRHAFELYEVLVHVPMMIRVPGQPGRIIDATRSEIDLIPTIFDLLGATKGSELRGESFMPELFGAKAEPRDIICDLPEDVLNERRRSLRHDNYKLIAFANDFRYELYDLSKDPGETDNLIHKDPEVAKTMIALYKKLSATIHDEPIVGGVQRQSR